MEGVDDIGIVEVGRGGLIGDVDRMREGQIPDRERLELCVAGSGAVFVLVIELRQAGGELARARAGRVTTTSGRVVSTNSFLP